MIEIPGQDLAGKWNGYMTVEYDTLIPALQQVFGEMVEGMAEEAGCESSGNQAEDEEVVGRVLECTIDITPTNVEEGKYQAVMQIKNSGSETETEASTDTGPTNMEATLSGGEVTITGTVQFLTAEISGTMTDSDNIDGSFCLKMLAEYASQLQISPDLEMSGSFRAARVKE
jgi:hypothetical protein